MEKQRARRRNPIFAAWFETYLKDWEITQSAVARLMGLKQGVVSRWTLPTASQITPDYARMLADVLQLPRALVMELAGFGVVGMTEQRAQLIAAAIDDLVRSRGGAQLAPARVLEHQWSQPTKIQTTDVISPTNLLLASNPILLAQASTEDAMMDSLPVVPSKPVPIYAVGLADTLSRQPGGTGDGHMPLDVQFVPLTKLRNPASPVQGWRMEGDAPAPFVDGETVVVELTADWRPGDRVAAFVGADLYLRRIIRNGAGFVLLAEDATAPIHVDDTVDIRGRVVARIQYEP